MTWKAPPSRTPLLERNKDGSFTGKMSAEWVRYFSRQPEIGDLVPFTTVSFESLMTGGASSEVIRAGSEVVFVHFA